MKLSTNPTLEGNVKTKLGPVAAYFGGLDHPVEPTDQATPTSPGSPSDPGGNPSGPVAQTGGQTATGGLMWLLGAGGALVLMAGALGALRANLRPSRSRS